VDELNFRSGKLDLGQRSRSGDGGREVVFDFRESRSSDNFDLRSSSGNVLNLRSGVDVLNLRSGKLYLGQRSRSGNGGREVVFDFRKSRSSDNLDLRSSSGNVLDLRSGVDELNFRSGKLDLRQRSRSGDGSREVVFDFRKSRSSDNFDLRSSSGNVLDLGSGMDVLNLGGSDFDIGKRSSDGSREVVFQFGGGSGDVLNFGGSEFDLLDGRNWCGDLILDLRDGDLMGCQMNILSRYLDTMGHSSSNSVDVSLVLSIWSGGARNGSSQQSYKDQRIHD